MREYHCTTCDFHITGPADEVADEIEAHEEQHHAETPSVSGVEITPEILRAVANWLPCECADDEDAVDAIRRHARYLERERADEKRIDALAAVAYEAAQKHLQSTFNEWGRASDSAVGLYRAIARAILAKHDDECEQQCSKGEVIDQ